MSKTMARIQNDVVINIERHSDYVRTSEDLVPVKYALVSVGDSYMDEKFYRDGKQVPMNTNALRKEISEYDSALSEIEAAIGITNAIHTPISAVIDKRKQDIISRISEML